MKKETHMKINQLKIEATFLRSLSIAGGAADDELET
jgi:hypothetical protein